MPPPIGLEYFPAKISAKSEISGSTGNSVPLVRRRGHAPALQRVRTTNYNLKSGILDGWGKLCYDAKRCRCGGTGRHKGLKIPRRKKRTGSIPVTGTKKEAPHRGASFLVSKR